MGDAHRAETQDVIPRFLLTLAMSGASTVAYVVVSLLIASKYPETLQVIGVAVAFVCVYLAVFFLTHPSTFRELLDVSQFTFRTTEKAKEKRHFSNDTALRIEAFRRKVNKRFNHVFFPYKLRKVVCRDNLPSYGERAELARGGIVVFVCWDDHPTRMLLRVAILFFSKSLMLMAGNNIPYAYLSANVLVIVDLMLLDGGMLDVREDFQANLTRYIQMFGAGLLLRQHILNSHKAVKLLANHNVFYSSLLDFTGG